MPNRDLQIPSIYQLQITLLDIEPAIFRTIVLPSESTLRQLHDLIQSAFGWENCHLHAFRDKKGINYTASHEGVFAMDMEPEDIDEATVRLDSVIRTKRDKLMYEYDFGDGWIHEISLKKKETPKLKGLYPAVIDGAGACPPEDCGGPHSYVSTLQMLKNKRHGAQLEPNEERMLEWFGEDFDPKAFDIDVVNNRIAMIGKHS